MPAPWARTSLLQLRAVATFATLAVIGVEQEEYGRVTDYERLEKEVTQVKMLLMLLLMKLGTQQSEIAKITRMDRGALSRLIGGKVKPFKKSDSE